MILSSRQHAENEREGNHPALSSYSPVVERLDQVVDAMNSNTVAVIAAAGSKKIPKVRPQPRPSTAYETVTHRRRLAGQRSLASRFMRSKQVDSDQQ